MLWLLVMELIDAPGRYAMFIWWLLPSVCSTPRTCISDHNLVQVKLSKFILPALEAIGSASVLYHGSLHTPSILQKCFFHSAPDLTGFLHSYGFNYTASMFLAFFFLSKLNLDSCYPAISTLVHPIPWSETENWRCVLKFILLKHCWFTMLC